MNQTLIIDNVDFDKLEKQRKTLNSVLSLVLPITREQEEDLEGLEAMLDEWSDKRYRDEQ